MNDYYSHVDKKLIYIPESIPGPIEENKEYEDLIDHYNSQITSKCTCEICTESDCKCIQNSGGLNYVVEGRGDKRQFKLNYEKNSKTYPVIECNDLCSCLNNCMNRVVQKGPIGGLYVKPCKLEGKGLGLFTENFIPAGVFICEYAGEIITLTEAAKRHQSNQSQGRMNYIFCLKEHAKKKIVHTVIDPSQFGNIGRYINHSCEANCEIVPVRINCPIPKLGVFSCTDILRDTEITFDYGSDRVDKGVSISTRLTQDRKVCLCGSEKCRGFLPYDA
ncbi:probable histone-lysine N-methyltransferase set-23 [Epargyreus clarus]|uniref:probable histone-lysine N-methyltransferase set-23 n=1 Tax=Epargyreus clarus TaxID=520877 RepID=UPI003C2C74C1